jgi:two-component system, sensor histidine kinase and response regulator
MSGVQADAVKGNILIVDDSPANLRLLASMLGEQGYKVRPVISGTMGLTAARAAVPDLILLDINMPDMNGFDVCRQLKAGEPTRDVPIIFISALDEIEDKLHAFTVGGVDYITKPFQFEEVLARVETHLALRRLQRQLEEANTELARNLVELQARNEELDAFAHTVAHDLKNPLTALVGYSTMLEARYDAMEIEQVARVAAAIAKNGRRMTNIIEELLLLAGVRKMEHVEVQPLDMGPIVDEVLARLQDMIHEHGARIVRRDEWPLARGRAGWVEEVWANYLSNAIKYGGTPPQIELGYTPGERAAQPESGCHDTERAASKITFWVRDNGPGLTPEEQARLFAPFERLHQVRAEGHGLGLSIVRRIVNKLGGEVGVESAPGEGSLFYFTLPAVEAS